MALTSGFDKPSILSHPQYPVNTEAAIRKPSRSTSQLLSTPGSSRSAPRSCVSVCLVVTRTRRRTGRMGCTYSSHARRPSAYARLLSPRVPVDRSLTIFAVFGQKRLLCLSGIPCLTLPTGRAQDLTNTPWCTDVHCLSGHTVDMESHSFRAHDGAEPMRESIWPPWRRSVACIAAAAFQHCKGASSCTLLLYHVGS